MRPLRLTLEGLRSYRHARTVDFTDKGLLAVVGDTGAGKSSILEGITYALYSAATWSGQPGELIADGARTMRVQLDFVASGQTWRATRSMSRDGYPAPVHRLECLETGERVNGRTEVNARVVRLVGLDHKAFCQAVVLPQGRFADLLKAPRTERGKILQNIFRVDDVLACKGLAEAYLARWLPQHEGRVEARRQYPDDPAADARAAEELRLRAEERVAALDGLGKVLRTLELEAARADERVQQLERAAGDLSDSDVTGFVADLEEMARAAVLLSQEHRALERRRAAAGGEEESARRALAEAEAEGAGLEALVAADATLAALSEDLDRLGQAAEEAAGEAAGLEALAPGVDALAARARRSAAQEVEARRAEAEAKERAEEARAAQEAAGRALTEARRSGADRDRALARARELAEAAAEDERTVERLREEVAAAEAAAGQAEKELHAAEHAALAAAAAAECAPGDDCPVCARPLPDGWLAPVSPALDAARWRGRRAGSARDEVTKELTRAEAGLKVRRREQERLAKEVLEAEHAAEEAVGRLAGLLRLGVAETTSRLDEDGVLLDGLTAALRRADEELARATSEWRARWERATEDHKAGESAARELDEARKRHVRRVADLSKLLAAVHDRVSRLAPPVRPPVAGPGCIDLAAAPGVRQEALGAGAPARSRAQVGQRLDALRQLEAKRHAAAARGRELDDALARLHQRQRQEVDIPTGEALARAGGLADRLQRAAALALVDLPPPPARPPSGEAAELAPWAAQLEAAAERAGGMLRAAARAAAAEARERRREAVTRLAAAGLGDPDALDKELLDARLGVQHHQWDRDRALEAARRVAVLDDQIARGGELLDTLKAVRDQLTEARFVAFLLHRRQQALLAVASALLGSMTLGRYGFSEDFDIVDRYSGQPRSPQTLSGGESFLASLALAMALVELLNRAGGRVDALFLDEGFGTLDANNLEMAIDTLEERARSGRLVAVISHVKAVAERIDDVLAVTCTPEEGSDVRFLTPEERGRLVADDVTAGFGGLLG